MNEPVLNRRLSAEDAIFVYGERKESPLHIGSVHTFEGTIPYDDFVRTIHSRLSLIPRYRQILVLPPYFSGHPTWEFDPHFDIRRHILRLQIEPPGGDAELGALASRIFSTMMDRSKSLWEIYLVEGLTGGRSALISRVHHAMADGMSGVGLMNIMMDASPDWKRPKPVRYRRPPLPKPDQLVGDALQSTVFGSLKRLVDVQQGLLDLGRALLNQPVLEGMRKLGDLADLLPEMAAPVERLPFNRPGSTEKKYFWTECPIADVNAIRAKLGGTLNDVVLTAQAGAIRQYLKLHHETLGNRLLRVMVPVNLRREDQNGALGNRVSMLPLSIPLDIHDPARRLKAISLRTETMKSTRLADLFSLFGTWFGAVPAPWQAALSALPLLSTPTPLFNVVSTNVRGPDFPIYTVGKRMLTFCPYVPVGHELGVSFAVQSYNHKLYFGITGDAAAAPDVDRLRDFLDVSLAELRQAAGLPAASDHGIPTAPAPSAVPALARAAAGGR